MKYKCVKILKRQSRTYVFSDYGYATSDRTCLAKTLYSSAWVPSCYNNDWLKIKSQWTIIPYANSHDVFSIFRVSDDSYVGYGHAHSTFAAYPTVYLNTDVKITSGNGSIDLPYELTLS